MNVITHAKITTNIALKDSANMIKSINHDIVCNKFEIMKKTKKSIFNFYHNLFDEYHKGCLISKHIMKASELKTSKHLSYLWTFLYYDYSKPFTRMEEHLIGIHSTILNTKNPAGFNYLSLGIYVTRHLLERSALRFNANTTEEMVGFLSPYVQAAFMDEIKKQSFDEGGLLLMTQNEYVIIDSISSKEIIFKTVVPEKDWSIKKRNKLKNVISALDQEISEPGFSSNIAYVNLSAFNNSMNDLREEDYGLIFFDY